MMHHPSAAAASLQAVWRQRALRLAQRPPATVSGDHVTRVMVVVIGEERYGIGLADVAEVLPPVTITPLPGAPPELAGVINVHGEIRPVLDLPRLLGAASVSRGGPVRVVLLRNRARVLGIPVAAIENIRPVGADEWQDSGAASNKFPVRYVQGFTRDMLRLLCTESLFSDLLGGAIA